MKPAKVITKTAVLLIPDPERAEDSPRFGIKPGYYDSVQLLQLVLKHKNAADAIQFIADMLEAGNAEDDSFAALLRKNRNKPMALAKIVEACK